MAYQKQTWVDGSTGGTPINSTRLNHMEDGIYDASYDDVYSTTETLTNKVWINGEPIYRTVYTGTGSGIVSLTAPSNVSQMIDMRGIIQSSYGQWWTVPNYYGHSTNYWTSINYNQGATQISLETGSYYNNSSEYIVIVEYTKSS